VGLEGIGLNPGRGKGDSTGALHLNAGSGYLYATHISAPLALGGGEG